jgi:zinc protease
MRRLAVCLALVIAGATAAPAQVPLDTAALARDPAATLPLLETIRAGTLPNGLRYFIRANTRPEQRAELRLVVDAGSIQETPDQRGLAHVVEHMLFNGTRRFPKQSIVEFLESVGMRFGADLNATTTFDETTYQLTVPTDRAALLDRALDILVDWAHAATFDSVEVEQERGVVIEEWRLGRGAGMRIADRQFPILFQGSRYAERLPIGTRAVLDTYTRGHLLDFYRTWYRPDRMSVVVVGTVEPARVEAMIREKFAVIAAPAAPSTWHGAAVPSHPDPLVVVASDPEATQTVVELVRKLPPTRAGTVGAFRADLVAALFDAMLNGRFEEITQRPGAPFLVAQAAHSALVRMAEMVALRALAADGGSARALEALVTEAERVRRHGFAATELARATAELREAYRSAAAERDKTNSSPLADELARHALTGEPVPGIAVEEALVRALLPGITLDEVNAVARTTLAASDRVVMVSAPDKAGLTPPTETTLRDAIARAAAVTLAAWDDRATDGPLVPTPPRPGRVIAERAHPAVGVTEWRLGNGVRVLLKPTDFKADEIWVAATSPGGASLVPAAEFASAQFGSQVVNVSGLGDFDAIALRKRLAGVSAGGGPTLSRDSEGWFGQAAPKDLPTLFELLWLGFTAPRYDSAAVAAFREQVRAAVVNRGADPDAVFDDTVAVTLSGHHPLVRPLTPAYIDSLDPVRGLARFRERFADAGDFTVVIVGAFTVDSVRPLVERWLGALPAAGRREAARDLGIRAPSGIVDKVVRRGTEPKARTRIVFTGAATWDRPTRYAVTALAEVLELRLRDALREELGATYGVSVSGAVDRLPAPRFTVSLDFGSAPERTEPLTDRIWRIVDSLRAGHVRDDDVQKVREIALREREVQRRQNGFWVGVLVGAADDGTDPADVLGHEAWWRGLTPAQVADAARRFLPRDAYLRFRLLPDITPPVP